MKDISYHLLDIIQNSLNAGANKVEIHISETKLTGRYELTITDNGRGMSAAMLKEVIDPFFTTSTSKKVGLGLPLLKQNVELTQGAFNIASAINKGTTVTAIFNSYHIDMIPVGDLAMTFKTLIASNPDRDFVYRHRKDKEGFDIDTAEIRMNLDGVPLNTLGVLDYIADAIRENLKILGK
jgi:hypothetical protein